MWYYNQTETKVLTFIFDAHRPFHHNNIIDLQRKIFIVHDGCNSFEKYPTQEDIQILQEFAEEDEDEEDEEQEYDSDDSEREEAKEELENLKD